MSSNICSTHRFLPRARPLLVALTLSVAAVSSGVQSSEIDPKRTTHLEVPDDPFIEVPESTRTTSPGGRYARGDRVSVQVNIDSDGLNIVGDAANEPSLAVDPTDPERLAIGWRQFDTIASNFRQAGHAFSSDAGETWTFPGVLNPGVFQSDPVLDFDSRGNFFYNSLGISAGFSTDTYKSIDGGATWAEPVFSHGGDKLWSTVDRSGGMGEGHLYQFWTAGLGCCGHNHFNRTVNGAASFEFPIPTSSEPQWGTLTVGPSGDVYVAGASPFTGTGFAVLKSSTLQDRDLAMGFDSSTEVELGGPQGFREGPNPDGLLGQVWIAVDSSERATHGNVYILSSIDPPGADPMDVHFVRSVDGGATWSAPVRVNDDAGTSAWQWFGTMSVAPDGRIDAIWNDTRNAPEVNAYSSELFYSYSIDGGLTWSVNETLSPAFDPHLGWPQQNKLGDYYDMVSDTKGASLAYAATFNGEQDVYFLRIEFRQIFSDGFESGDTSAWTLD